MTRRADGAGSASSLRNARAAFLATRRTLVRTLASARADRRAYAALLAERTQVAAKRAFTRLQRAERALFAVSALSERLRCDAQLVFLHATSLATEGSRTAAHRTRLQLADADAASARAAATLEAVRAALHATAVGGGEGLEMLPVSST